MVGFWIDFIASGDPNLTSDDWRPSEKEHRYLNISGLHPSMDSSTSLHERMDLWEEIMNNQVTTSPETSTDVPTTIIPTKGPVVCLEANKEICYKGSWMTTGSDYNATFASFQGIQYAQAPIGNLRFKSPLPYQEANGEHDVSKKIDILCTQFGQMTGSRSSEAVVQEDCLLLNIYAPEIAIDGLPLPVMVWIHGGALTIGSGRMDEYGPQYFMDTESVVVVTINYRLGPFGFLSMGTEDVPGNAGFRDQSLALKWVNDNIANFGGDPETISIAGESAGSLSVALHLVSPMSQGLFQRAILQSGTGLSPNWEPNTPEQALKQADQVSTAVGCDEEDDILSCLQRRDVDEFVSMTLEWASPWQGVLDNGFTSDPFLPGSVKELLQSEQFNQDVEVIIGTNSAEGILTVGPMTNGLTQWDEFRGNIELNGPSFLFGIPNPSDFTDEDFEKMNKIINYYVGSIENINDEHKHGVIDMFTDAGFQYGTHQTINLLVEQNVTLYQYLLTYQGEYSASVFFGGTPPGNGVCHGDDLIYLWVAKASGTADISDLLGNKFNILSSHHLLHFLILFSIFIFP